MGKSVLKTMVHVAASHVNTGYLLVGLIIPLRPPEIQADTIVSSQVKSHPCLLGMEGGICIVSGARHVQ